MPRLTKEFVELWASVAEIVAAVGVIISIVYLAIGVNEGTLSLETQTHSDFVTLVNEPLLAMVSNDELSRVVAQGLVNPDSLSPEEWSRFVNYQIVIWNVWEYGYYLDKSGATRIEAWEGGDAYFSERAATLPGLAKVWREAGIAYAEPFHSYVEAFIKRNPNYKANASNGH